MSRAIVPPHAPKIGPLRRLLGPFYVTGVFWYRFHRWGAATCPAWLKPALIRAFATAFWLLLPAVRRAAGGNLGAVLGPCSRVERARRAFRLMHLFSWCLTERYENLNADPGFRWSTEGIEHWNALTGRAGGFILLTGHLGNWEIGSMLPSGSERRTIHVVREGEMDPKAQAFVRELLAKRIDGPYVTHFASDDASLGIALLDALREGHIVALQGDRPRTQGKALPMTLFGRPFELPVGPFALARLAGVPILPAFTLRSARKDYRVVFRPPITVEPAGDRNAALDAAAGEVARTLETMIRCEPYQWFCFRELWPDHPREASR